MIKAVIFDFDGTLITFNLDIKACRSEIINHLTKQGFPHTLFSQRETAFDMLEKVRHYMKIKGIERQKFAKIKKICDSCIGTWRCFGGTGCHFNSSQFVRFCYYAPILNANPRPDSHT